MINCSGFKVWPAEVEAMLYAHPDIQEACVIGTLDGYRGETVKAVIVLKNGSKQKITPAEITDWARERMAAFKVPRVVQFVDELPKTATGKILWRKLQLRADPRRRAPHARRHQAAVQGRRQDSADAAFRESRRGEDGIRGTSRYTVTERPRALARLWQLAIAR